MTLVALKDLEVMVEGMGYNELSNVAQYQHQQSMMMVMSVRFDFKFQ